jgi:hypothetical protein
LPAVAAGIPGKERIYQPLPSRLSLFQRRVFVAALGAGTESVVLSRSGHRAGISDTLLPLPGDFALMEQ